MSRPLAIVAPPACPGPCARVWGLVPRLRYIVLMRRSLRPTAALCRLRTASCWPQRHGGVVGWRIAAPLAALPLLLGACAQTPAPAPESAALEKRLQALEWRFEALERYITNLPSPPQRSRAEIEQNIQSLEAQRVALLTRYTNAHPAVREVDLSLRLLRLQLEFLDRAKAPPP